MSKKFEELLAGEMCISLINEPIDLTALYEVPPLTVLEKARRRWRKADLICGGKEPNK